MIKPYYEEEGITLYHGDCLEIMPQLEDKSVDLVLTDPPYGANRDYENDDLSEVNHREFVNKYLSESKRITRDNLVIIIGVKYQKPVTMWLFNNMHYCWEFCWWKSNGMLNGKATFSKFEKVLWFAKNGGTYYRQKPEYTDVWNIPIRPDKNNFGHPTPKDIKGINRILNLLSKPNDLILDPFLGSGTTAVACKELGRKCIGIEISKEYCDIAIKRLKNTQKDMFL